MILLSGFRGTVVRNYPLASHTTWRVGGQAEVFAVPADIQDLIVLMTCAKDHGIPVQVLGRGSNLLISDSGVPGITLSLGRTFHYLERRGNTLCVGASVAMPTVAQRAAQLGYAGLEHLVGIPGTIGAGIVMNAGKGTDNPSDMRAIVKTVTYLNAENELVDEAACELRLGYRTSKLQGTKAVVTEATFLLEHPAPTVQISQRMKQILAERRAKFPLQFPNAGSVFKRPAGHQPAGQLIDSLGLKGLRIGDAQISEKHANFIVNVGHATASQIRQLIAYIRQCVFAAYGIDLECEIVSWPLGVQ